jgi:RNA polymerase sigma factor for flagellar operon FliA
MTATQKRTIPAAGIQNRNDLVNENYSLVRTIALQVIGTLPVHIELEDLISTGTMGLLDAANKFEPARGIGFRTYAKFRIKGAMLDGLRQADCASRDLRIFAKKLSAVRRELTATLERQPTEPELAEGMGIGLDRLRQNLLDLHSLRNISMSGGVETQDELPMPEFPAPKDTSPELMTGRHELSSVLSNAMNELPPRYREVIWSHYMGDGTMREIGQVLGVNESRVSQIHRAALEKLSAILRKAGICSVECLA